MILFFFFQGKAPKEIHAILTETLACFLPARAKDLSAPLYMEEFSTVTVPDNTNSTCLCFLKNLIWYNQIISIL